jgi:hypothetical protein
VYRKIITLALLSGMFMIPVLYAQWTRISSSPQSLVRDIVESSGVLYLAHGSDGVYKSLDGAVTWQPISSGLNSSQAKDVYQLSVNGDVIYAATVDGIYKSTDTGENWAKKSNGITIGPGALYEFTESIYMHGDNLFTGAFNGIYRSIDDAEHWTVTNVSGHHVWAKNFVKHGGILFAAGNEGFPDGYKSIDDGATWDSLNFNDLYPAITFFSELFKLWAGTIQGVSLSTDNGISWQQRSNGLTPDPYSSSIIRINGTLLTSLKFGGSGVFSSIDDGLNWQNIGDGLPFLNSVEKLIVYEDRIVAATSDGLWQRDTAEVVTGFMSEHRPPENFELLQNYPNPFNPETVIRYQLPFPTSVRLDIYSLMGQKIKTVIIGRQSTGSHHEKWDGKNASGIPVTSGVYVYQLMTNAGIQSKKMILMR